MVPESLFPAITATTACGPAFVCLFLEAYIDAGIRVGLKAPLARELAIKNMEGALALLKGSDESPEEVRRRIQSPGGSTIRGVLAMEAGGMRSAIHTGVLASYQASQPA